MTQGIHVFLAYNGSMCMTSCKAPEGPLCQAACQYDDLARMFNSYIQAEQVRTQLPAAGRNAGRGVLLPCGSALIAGPQVLPCTCCTLQEATFQDAQGRTSTTADPATGVLLNGLVAEVCAPCAAGGSRWNCCFRSTLGRSSTATIQLHGMQAAHWFGFQRPAACRARLLHSWKPTPFTHKSMHTCLPACTGDHLYHQAPQPAARERHRHVLLHNRLLGELPTNGS